MKLKAAGSAVWSEKFSFHAVRDINKNYISILFSVFFHCYYTILFFLSSFFIYSYISLKTILIHFAFFSLSLSRFLVQIIFITLEHGWMISMYEKVQSDLAQGWRCIGKYFIKPSLLLKISLLLRKHKKLFLAWENLWQHSVNTEENSLLIQFFFFSFFPFILRQKKSRNYAISSDLTKYWHKERENEK